MKARVIVTVLLFALSLFNHAQTPSQATASDPWASLRFLEGSWQAATHGGAAGAAATGTYSFSLDLKQHILARHSSTDGACTGPQQFDCEHNDLLYIYREAPAAPLKAIYFDNEGHVIRYDVTTPKPGKAVFLSEGSQPGPRFQLVYELKDATMYGSFAAQMPGQSQWTTYLEWEGPKK